MPPRHAITKALADAAAAEDRDPAIAEAEVEHPHSVVTDRPLIDLPVEVVVPTAPVQDVAIVPPSSAYSADGIVAVEAEKSTPEQDRICELEKQLAQAQAKAPAPEAQLTADQKRIRELEDRLARAGGTAFENSEEVLVKANPGTDTILLHFLEDGFNALGRVWYKGQEVEFEVGGVAYKDTLDRNGKTWLSYLDDEFGQAQRWGKVMFRRGPWPGVKYTDDKALAEERRRNRAAPTLPIGLVR